MPLGKQTSLCGIITNIIKIGAPNYTGALLVYYIERFIKRFIKMFKKISDISQVAINILRKRYFKQNESTWDEVTDRIINHVLKDEIDSHVVELTREMILNRYFVPNSPCIVNAGKENGGLIACFVVDFPDNIEGIYKTKLDFALIAKKGGGCGTTLSKLRPKNSPVAGSVHGYAGGPVDFYNTICHDMEVMTQAGFRSMAQMGTITCRHPDILKFITSKEIEGKMTTTNISVVVDNDFMEKVENNETYWTEFKDQKFKELNAKDVFNLIVEGAWRNGEPGILFYDTINNCPYKYTGEEILATNPCGEMPLPFNGCCNLGSLDISKFLDENKELDLNLLSTAVELSINFLDSVIDKTGYPTKDIENWSLNHRPTGLGIMGLADYYLIRHVAYGSEDALKELEFILNFIYGVAENKSIELGEEYGIPEACKQLPNPRRNITILSIAPTGTISLIAGCNSGIEPIFSEITIRNDKTGSYQFKNISANAEYFRCAVSTNGGKEVTWEEHVKTQASAQKFVDSGVSKTINFPAHTSRNTIYNAFILAWKLGCKGLTVYRNNSRKVEVLSPKNIKKDLCPLCSSELLHSDGCKKCLNPECNFSFCDTN